MSEGWKATRPAGSAVRMEDVGPDRTIHLATPHGDLDLLSEKIAGIPFAQLRERADVNDVDGVPAPICSLVDLSDLETAHGELPTAGS